LSGNGRDTRMHNVKTLIWNPNPHVLAEILSRNVSLGSRTWRKMPTFCSAGCGRRLPATGVEIWQRLGPWNRLFVLAEQSYLKRFPSRNLFGTLVIVAGVVDCWERCCRQLFDTVQKLLFFCMWKAKFWSECRGTHRAWGFEFLRFEYLFFLDREGRHSVSLFQSRVMVIGAIWFRMMACLDQWGMVLWSAP